MLITLQKAFCSKPLGNVTMKHEKLKKRKRKRGKKAKKVQLVKLKQKILNHNSHFPQSVQKKFLLFQKTDF